MTIHKSQGSEYPAVVIPLMTQHYTMLQRNLLYTGVTRGRKLVVLVGQKKAVAIAVRNVSGRRRWSKLKEWLRPAAPTVRSFTFSRVATSSLLPNYITRARKGTAALGESCRRRGHGLSSARDPYPPSAADFCCDAQHTAHAMMW